MPFFIPFRLTVLIAVAITILSVVIPLLRSTFSAPRDYCLNEDISNNRLNAIYMNSSMTNSKETTLFGHNDRIGLMRNRRERDELVHTTNVERFRSNFVNAPDIDALPKADFVDILEKMGFGSKHGEGQAWGFVIFRVVYGDESKWALFKSTFDRLIESQFRQAKEDHDKSGLEKFGPRWSVMWVEDEKQLNNASIEEVRNRYHALLEKAQKDESDEWMLLDQLDGRHILMVDPASFDSVFSGEGDEEPGIEDNHIADDSSTPFITIIDVYYTPEESEAWNKGYLKVAIAGLVNEIWPNLKGDMTIMEEQVVPVERIWRYVIKADNIEAIVQSCMTDPGPDFEVQYGIDSSLPLSTTSAPNAGSTYVVDHVIELSTIKYFFTSIVHNKLPSGIPFSTFNIPDDTFDLFNQEWSILGIDKEGSPASTLMTLIGSYQDDTNLQILESSLRGLKTRVWTAVPSIVPPAQYRALAPLQRVLVLQKIVGVFNYLNSPSIHSTLQTVYRNINDVLAAFDSVLKSQTQTKHGIQSMWREFFLDVARNMEMNAQMFLIKRIREEQRYWHEEYERIVEMNGRVYIRSKVQEEEEEYWRGPYQREGPLAEYVLDAYEKLAGEISTLVLFDTRWLFE